MLKVFQLLLSKYTNITCSFWSSVRMSDAIGGDSNRIYSYVNEITGCGNGFEVLDKCIPNPAYGYTLSNKTAGKIRNLEGSHPIEQPIVESNVDRKKANALPVKNRVVCAANLIALVVAVVLLIAAGVAIIISFVEISKLRAEVTELQALENSVDVRLSGIEIQVNSSELNDEIHFQNISNSISTQQSVIDQLSSKLNNSQLNDEINFENISNRISIQQNVINQLNSEINNNSGLISNFATILDEEHIFASCAAIQQFFPFQPSSGYYNIRSSNGSAITAYCDMTRSCGGITGGWMRVAELDMTDNTTQCPDNLELRTTPLRTCSTVNTGDRTSCSSNMFSVNGIQYSNVCGRIRAYQVGTTDAFGTGIINIDSNYVDGVSLTYGGFPRQHIWTFASAFEEGDQRAPKTCPCINTAISDIAITPPPFVEYDYFCDTGVDSEAFREVFYSADPLWDGAGCGPQNSCCSFNSPPWFYKQLPQTTTDDIEMRVCRTDNREDIAIEIIEIYVL